MGVGRYVSRALALGLAVLASSAAHATYWNLFNVEDNRSIDASYATYATLADMLTDTNRTGIFQPNGGGAGFNLVGSGSNGTTYWNLFNVENNRTIPAGYATYATLADMLTDTNRTGTFEPNGGGAALNLVDGSSDSFPSTTVPEPAAWTMMIIGFGLIGAMQRRRPRRAVV